MTPRIKFVKIIKEEGNIIVLNTKINKRFFLIRLV